MEDFPFLNVWLQTLVFLCLYHRWVMIHMLVRDGRRSPDACWPVREMWQRLVCRDKLESVACSTQSLQGLAKTPTESCLPSLSFISFSFTLSILHVSSISRYLPYFVQFLFPSSSFTSLLSCQPCQHLSDVSRHTHTHTCIFSNNFSSCLFCCCTLSASISDLIQRLAEAQLVQLAHICAHPPTHPHTHTHTHTHN